MRQARERGGYHSHMQSRMQSSTKILVPEHLHAELLGPAREAAPSVQLLPYSEAGTDPEGLGEAAGVLRWVAGKAFAQLVEAGPLVRWLHTASAGVDHVLTPSVRGKPNLVVTDSGPAFEIAIAEFVFAWMLMAARGLPGLLAHQRERCWQPVPQFELHGKTVGIIGLGPIGRGTAVRAQAFGMRTLGLRRTPLPVEGIDVLLTGPEGLARLLDESDFVVVAAALTGDTRTLIGADQLARMKPTAWLINIARGGLVDEPALIAALQSGRIGGACLDVFAQEPLPEHSPLWDLPNTYLAPHNSPGWDPNLHARQAAIFVDNLRRFAQGEPLANAVDMARGY